MEFTSTVFHIGKYLVYSLYHHNLALRVGMKRKNRYVTYKDEWFSSDDTPYI